MTGFEGLAKLLVIAGSILLAGGLILGLWGHTSFPLGRLPGDIVIKKENFTLYFPIATTLILSLVLTVVISLVLRFINK